MDFSLLKTVKEIYDFFHQYPNADKKSASLMDFLKTIPGFLEAESSDDHMPNMNMSIGMEYLRICEKMCEDLLLLKVQNATIFKIDSHYIAVDSVNSSNPKEFIRELEYGK